MPSRVAYATVASGDTVSAAVGLGNTERISIWCPTVTSGQLRLLGSFDQTSANFVPVFDTSSQGRWFANIGPGSATVAVNQMVLPAFGKIDLSVAQAAPRSFAIFTR